MLISLSIGINTQGFREEDDDIVLDFINLDAISNYVYIGNCFNCSVGINNPVGVGSDDYVYMSNCLTVTYS